MMNKIELDIISLKYFLNGNKYYKASKALELVLKIHNGLRKDRVTPEYYHQLCIAHLLRTLTGHLIHPETTITAGLLHDVVEDHGDKFDLEDIERIYGVDIAESVDILTKTGKLTQHYYANISNHHIASIVKGVDRIHNHQSMVGVFTVEKQKSYMVETEDYVLPMLEAAAKEFPEQEPAYANVRLILISQIELIRHIHAQNVGLIEV